jgi:regulator of protease activity HflC (stomatin/prohibitin superfamily)
MASDLYSRQVGIIESTSEVLGSDVGAVILRPTISTPYPWFDVPEGCYALVTKFGEEMLYPGSDNGSYVWPPGRHYYPPWYKISNLVTMQSIVFDTPVKGAKTKDNVNCWIDLDVVFRIMGCKEGEDPNLVRRFVHEVTPRGLQAQLLDALDEAVRTMARSVKHTEVFGLRSATVSADGEVLGFEDDDDLDDEDLIGDHSKEDEALARRANTKGQSATEAIRDKLNDQFMPQGVEVVDVIVTDVRLPDNIMMQMRNKTMVISENAQQKMNQEFDMQSLVFEEEVKTVDQLHSEERLMKDQEGKRELTEVRLRLEKLRADVNRGIRQIEAESGVRVSKTEEETKLEVTKLTQTQNKKVVGLQANSRYEAARLVAEADAFCEEKLSEAQKEVALNEAEAARLISEMEGRIAPMLHVKKEHTSHLKRLDVWKALSGNDRLVISSSDDEQTNTLLLVDRILAQNPTSATRSEILSEMLVMSQTSGQSSSNMNLMMSIDT